MRGCQERWIDSVAKRCMDLTASAAGIAILSPIFLAVASLIKAVDRGPVFYCATRVGRHGRLFRLYKFRTMVVDADRLGAAITSRGDPRVTRIGRWLRRTKLDELPQLVNVLKGDMSLVGPRPEDPRYVGQYTPEQRRVLAVRPGITSPASLAYRHEEHLLNGPHWETAYREIISPAKLAIELDYLSRRTLATDIRIILRTLRAVMR